MVEKHETDQTGSSAADRTFQILSSRTHMMRMELINKTRDHSRVWRCSSCYMLNWSFAWVDLLSNTSNKVLSGQKSQSTTPLVTQDCRATNQKTAGNDTGYTGWSWRCREVQYHDLWWIFYMEAQQLMIVWSLRWAAESSSSSAWSGEKEWWSQNHLRGPHLQD